MKADTVSVGPVRIPREHKQGLDQLRAGKAHITYSALIREAIYLLLIEKGIIRDPSFTTWEELEDSELNLLGENWGKDE